MRYTWHQLVVPSSEIVLRHYLWQRERHRV